MIQSPARDSMTQFTGVILNHMKGSADRNLFDQHSRDNCCEPYLKLRSRCAELGYPFQVSAHHPIVDARWLLFWDASSVTPTNPIAKAVFNLKVRVLGGVQRDLLKEAERLHAQDKLALIILETLPASPGNWDRALLDRFSVVFTWDPRMVDGVKYHRFYLPNPTYFPAVKRIPFKARKLLANISGNNFVTHDLELYSARRAAIKFFQDFCPNDFDLYGPRWNPTWKQYLIRRLRNPAVRWEKYSVYRGVVKSKAEVYPNYKFALCYENTREQPGYVTEKIFDCLRAGVVPIYWGAPDISEYVDPDAFIDRRDFESLEDLAKFLVGIDERVFQRYQEAAQRYLQSSKFKLFLSESFTKCITRGLRLVPDIASAPRTS